MKKLHKQLAAIFALILWFAVLDFGIYRVFTKRCISDYSEGMRAKSVELDKYLPFDENSEIVKINSAVKLSGNLPTLDGAAALYPVFSAFVNAVYPTESCEFDGENFSAESKLQMNNTRGAYKAVVDGEDDIIFCAKPSEEQLEYAKKKGVELELVPIGYEAFVFIVNSENPVENLTCEQIRGIYSGEYNNWAEVGGENKPIAALSRNEGSGSQTAMLSFMGTEKIKRDYDTFLGSAIGYSFRYYVEGIVKDGGVKLISVDGAYPNEENIKNGSYPIVSNFYAVYLKDNANPNIPVLIDWILSEEGQQIISETGYVSIENAEQT